MPGIGTPRKGSKYNLAIVFDNFFFNIFLKLSGLSMAQKIKIKNLTQTTTTFNNIPENEYFITVGNYHLCFRIENFSKVLDLTALAAGSESIYIDIADNTSCMAVTEVDIAVTRL